MFFVGQRCRIKPHNLNRVYEARGEPVIIEKIYPGTLIKARFCPSGKSRWAQRDHTAHFDKTELEPLEYNPDWEV